MPPNERRCASSGNSEQQKAKAQGINPGPFPYGADDEIRTRDPHLGKVMLYQLSHVRVGLSE